MKVAYKLSREIKRAKRKVTCIVMLMLILMATLTSVFNFVVVGVAGAPVTVRCDWLSFSVTLDGKMTTADEWSDTVPVDLNLTERHVGPGSVSARIWMKNDDTWLYMLYRIIWPAEDIDPFDGGFIDYFSEWIGEPSPLWNSSDMNYIGFNNVTWDAYGWNETGWYSDTDALPPGENNVEGAATHDGTYYWFEFRKTLDSGDGYDWSFSPGQIIEPVFEPVPENHLLVGLWDADTRIPYEEYITLHLAAPKDVLIIDDANKYAYFGWFKISQIPSLGLEATTTSSTGLPQVSSTGWEPMVLTNTTVYVDPNIVDEDSPPVNLGYRFNVTLRIDNVTDLLAWQVMVIYDSTVLNATGAWVPSWDHEYVFYGLETITPSPYFGAYWVLMADLLMNGEPTFQGNGTLGIIEFQVIKLPPELGWLESPLNINNTDTFLLNSNRTKISVNKVDGLYRIRQRPPVGWDLLNRTITWATNYMLPNETSIVLFTRDGSLDPISDPDGKALYDKLIVWGYNATNIHVRHQNDIEILNSSYYRAFHLVIYAEPNDHNSISVVNSSVPFVTFAAGQTDEMGIGTGVTTMHSYNNTFYVVNNNYYPTYNYPSGQLLFEAEIEFEATEATGNGKVLVKAEEVSIVSEVKMSLAQDIYVSPDGGANMSFIITACSSSPSPLADTYREAFFTDPPPFEPEVEYEVPENKTVHEYVDVEEGIKDTSLTGDVTGPEGWPDGKVDILDVASIAILFGVEYPDPKYNFDYDIVYDGKIDVVDVATAAINFGKVRQQQFGTLENGSPSPEQVEAVREMFHQGVFLDQAVLLGFNINVTDSRIVPWGANNETRVYVNAYSPQLAELLNSSIWRIYVGPQDENSSKATSEFMLTKIQYIQLMLRSWSGEQTLLCNWSLTIHLPPQAELLNLNELLGLNWTVDFGGGTFIEAHVIADPQSVTINEVMIVTEQNITASETYLEEAFAVYRVFSIDYFLPTFLKQAIKVKTNSLVDDWSKKWTFTISLGTYSKTWSLGPLKVTVRVRPKLTTQWYVGWKTKWWKLRWFKTWMKVTPSITAEAIATATASYTKTWSYTFATWSRRFGFWVGIVPVWAKLRLTVTASIKVRAYAQISATASITASAWVKAGVKWKRGSGWSRIWSHGAGASRSGPSISGSASLYIAPSVKARLAFLFYDVAGPFVEGKAYAAISIKYSTSSRTWSISLKFKVIAGVTFAGWLKKLVKLRSYSRTLADWRLASWSGNW